MRHDEKVEQHKTTKYGKTKRMEVLELIIEKGNVNGKLSI